MSRRTRHRPFNRPIHSRHGGAGKRPPPRPAASTHAYLPISLPSADVSRSSCAAAQVAMTVRTSLHSGRPRSEACGLPHAPTYSDPATFGPTARREPTRLPGAASSRGRARHRVRHQSECRPEADSWEAKRHSLQAERPSRRPGAPWPPSSRRESFRMHSPGAVIGQTAPPIVELRLGPGSPWLPPREVIISGVPKTSPPLEFMREPCTDLDPRVCASEPWRLPVVDRAVQWPLPGDRTSKPAVGARPRARPTAPHTAWPRQERGVLEVGTATRWVRRDRLPRSRLRSPRGRRW